MKKYIVMGIVAAAVAAIGVKFFTTQSLVRGRPAIRTVAVETARITRASLGDTARFTGSIYAEERYDATPKISGILRQVHFNVGDIVRRGDVLAVIDDDEYQLAVDQAKAKLRVAHANANDAEKQLEISRRNFSRTDNLLQENVISVQEYDAVEALYQAALAKKETAQAEVHHAEAELKTAEVRLGYTRIIAEWTNGPDDRVIGQRYKDAGAIVTTTTPVISVLDISTVRAVIAVTEKEYARLTQGDRAAVMTDAFPGRVFEGRVLRIPQELDADTREAEVEIAVDNPARELKPGMFIRADIEFARHDNTPAALLEAVVRREDGTRGVYVVSPDRTSVAFAPVTEGIVDGALVELVGADDLVDREVVTLGQHLLREGIAVKVVER